MFKKEFFTALAFGISVVAFAVSILNFKLQEVKKSVDTQVVQLKVTNTPVTVTASPSATQTPVKIQKNIFIPTESVYPSGTVK